MARAADSHPLRQACLYADRATLGFTAARRLSARRPPRRTSSTLAGAAVPLRPLSRLVAFSAARASRCFLRCARCAESTASRANDLIRPGFSLMQLGRGVTVLFDSKIEMLVAGPRSWGREGRCLLPRPCPVSFHPHAAQLTRRVGGGLRPRCRPGTLPAAPWDGKDRASRLPGLRRDGGRGEPMK